MITPGSLLGRTWQGTMAWSFTINPTIGHIWIHISRSMQQESRIWLGETHAGRELLLLEVISNTSIWAMHGHELDATEDFVVRHARLLWGFRPPYPDVLTAMHLSITFEGPPPSLGPANNNIWCPSRTADLHSAQRQNLHVYAQRLLPQSLEGSSLWAPNSVICTLFILSAIGLSLTRLPVSGSAVMRRHGP